jgi:hypothetical protein
MARAFKHLDYDIKIDFFFSEHLHQYVCVIEGEPRAKLERTGTWIRHHQYDWMNDPWHNNPDDMYRFINRHWNAYLLKLIVTP